MNRHHVHITRSFIFYNPQLTSKPIHVFHQAESHTKLKPHSPRLPHHVTTVALSYSPLPSPYQNLYKPFTISFILSFSTTYFSVPPALKKAGGKIASACILHGAEWVRVWCAERCAGGRNFCLLWGLDGRFLWAVVVGVWRWVREREVVYLGGGERDVVSRRVSGHCN